MAEAKTNQGAERVAIVRIRGITGVRFDIKKTLEMLNLHRKNHCVVVPLTDVNRGMIQKVKDFTTYGTIDDDTFKLLEEKRKVEGQKSYRLSPPRGGFERKGIKTPFTMGGALGDRKEKINDLLKRMI